MNAILPRNAVDHELINRGFVQTEKHKWRGPLVDGVAVTIELPEDFPHQLPIFRVDIAQLPRRLPHIEPDGKVCIAAQSGLLVNSTRPHDVLRESIDRATTVLTDGIAGRNRDDFVTEFPAYWNKDGKLSGVGSIFDVNDDARSLVLCHFAGNAPPLSLLGLLGENRQQIETWASKTRLRPNTFSPAFYIPLTAALDVPGLGQDISAADFVSAIRARADTETLRLLNRRLQRPSLPIILVVSFPGRGTRIVVTAGLKETKTPSGFRHGKCPIQMGIAAASKVPVERANVERLDCSALTERTGTKSEFANKTVALVGCGAVGGFLAMQLAALGVGKLRLIDPDLFSSANVHRHVLGTTAIGRSKVSALKETIGLNFPNCDVQARPIRVEAIAADSETFIADSDLVLFATGDQTLELRMNEVLRDLSSPRVHAWLEAYGLGGHVLTVPGAGARGCLACLFEDLPTHGLYNKASFAGPGQVFSQSLSGCVGTFTPFGVLDAQRAAIEAARIVSDVLSGKTTVSTLTSWYESSTAFVASGFALSRRVGIFSEGERKRVENHINMSCAECG